MGRRTALVLTAVLACYLLLVAQRGVLLVQIGEPAGVGLGLAVLVLPVLGAVLVIGELRLGAAASRLARRRQALPPAPEALPEDAGERFERARAAVQADPEDWVAWFDLAEAYGAGRDSARGRRALRRAVALERGQEQESRP